MRRLSSAQAGPRGRTLSSLHGSLKRKLKKSLRLSSRSGMLDYSANLRSTPRRMQYLQLLSALHRTSGQDGNVRQVMECNTVAYMHGHPEGKGGYFGNILLNVLDILVFNKKWL